MFFLITHLLVGKYYPNLSTQLIIGCLCYAIIFIMLRDIVTSDFYENYKYYIFLLICVDLVFLIYKTKSKITPSGTSSSTKNNYIISSDNQNNSSTKIKKENNNDPIIQKSQLPDISLSSEINDFKTTHDLNLSSDANYSLFSSENNLSKSNIVPELTNLEINSEDSEKQQSESNLSEKSTEPCISL